MLLNFQFYFENENSHWINIYHAAGMRLVYHITHACYVFPQDCFYQLLQLHNKEATHIPKYDWLLMKGIFDGRASINISLVIENQDAFRVVEPHDEIGKMPLSLFRVPEEGDDIVVIGKRTDRFIFFHFFCCNLFSSPEGIAIHLFFLNAYDSIDHILDLWFDKNGSPMDRD